MRRVPSPRARVAQCAARLAKASQTGPSVPAPGRIPSSVGEGRGDVPGSSFMVLHALDRDLDDEAIGDDQSVIQDPRTAASCSPRPAPEATIKAS